MEATKRDEFGRVLRDALAVRSMTQKQLGDRVGASQPSVSAWLAAEAEPSATTVFEIERALEMPPGQLSKFLGYLPVSAVKTTATFEAVVTEDPLLDEPAKRGLLAMYRELTSRRPRGRPRRSGS